jgi:uncharacterized protein YndB with AHSA1/START domain
MLSTEIRIARPAPDVWRVVADYDHDPAWRAGVDTMAPSPGGLVEAGTTTAEVLRFGGRTYRNGGVVESVDPGRRFTWRTTSGVDARGAREVIAVDETTSVVRLTLDPTLTGARRLLLPMLRRQLTADGERLRSLLEEAVSPARR